MTILDGARRILVVRLDAIGDFVLTGPFLRELRRAAPLARITLLVNPRVLALARRCPHVDEVLCFEWRCPRRLRRLRRHARALRLALAALRSRRFDLAIVPRWDVDRYHGLVLARLSGAPIRVGWAGAGDDRLLTVALPAPTGAAHEVERGLAVLRALGAEPADDSLDLWASESDHDAAEALLAQAGELGLRPLAALAPGADAAKRRWPAAAWAEVGHRLIRRGARAVLVGGPDEVALGRSIAGALGSAAIDATGRLSVSASAALIARCALFVGADSGPMHLAAAAGVPSVVVSCHPTGGAPGHPNSPLRFGPWKVPSVVVRPARALPPCSDGCEARHAHCIATVSPDLVGQAAVDLLDHVARTRRAPPSTDVRAA